MMMIVALIVIMVMVMFMLIPQSFIILIFNLLNLV